MAKDEVSLFSLELVVDKLYIPQTPCVFPSVAFRFLEYPMVIISHVEKEVREQLRKKLTKDPNWQSLHQLRELQDKTGTFVMKKGKSCLFKISLSSLRKHLHVTPLYLIVVDSFHKVPKLVANTTVPLNGLIESINDDVIKNGDAVPSVHGDKGLYRLFNLMGDEIGYILIGFRLVSLGAVLMKHISENTTGQEKAVEIAETHTQATRKGRQMSTTVSSIHSIDPVLVAKSPKKSISTNTISQFEPEKPVLANNEVSDMFTQTEKRKSKKAHKASFLSKNVEQTDLTPEHDHPPPLYYKNTGVKTLWMKREYEDIEYDSYDESDRGSDISDKVGFPNDNIDHNPIKNSDAVDAEAEPRILSHESNDNLNSLLKDANSQSLFPVLSALMYEFAALKENRPPGVLSVKSDGDVAKPSGSKPKISSSDSSNLIQDKCSKCCQSYAMRLAPHSGGHRHVQCAEKGGPVPKNKSWLRRTPEVSVKKSKLMFGMTNSHRLRLEKRNPKWLKTVDANRKLNQCKCDDEYNSVTSDISTQIQRNLSSEIFTQSESIETNVIKQRDGLKGGLKTFTLENPRQVSKYSNVISNAIEKNLRNGDEINEKGSLKFSTTLEQVVRALERIDSVDSSKCDADAGELGNDVDQNKNTQNRSSIEIHVPRVPAMSHDDGKMMPSERPSKSDEITVSEKTDKVQVPEPRGFSLQANMQTVGSRDDSAMFQSTEETELCDLISDADDDDDKELSFDQDDKRVNVDGRPTQLSDSSSKMTLISDVDNAAVVTTQQVSVPNPMLSENSPIPSTRRSLAKGNGSVTSRHDSPSLDSYKRPTPRPKLAKLRESINTESLSTYAPSDINNLSLASGDTYSEDFHNDDDDEGNVSDKKKDESGSLSDVDIDEMLADIQYIPSTKLGYTIS